MLSFRHRFRNLYLFDLQPVLIARLLDAVADAWRLAEADIARFRARVAAIADALERDDGA